MATIESRIAVLERQSGAGYKLVLREDGETEDEARALAGLADMQGPFIYLSESDMIGPRFRTAKFRMQGPFIYLSESDAKL